MLWKVMLNPMREDGVFICEDNAIAYGNDSDQVAATSITTSQLDRNVGTAEEIVERHNAVVRDIIKQIKPERPHAIVQCVSCHNTESTAGVMQRKHFNPGRCVRCNGTFRVVSA